MSASHTLQRRRMWLQTEVKKKNTKWTWRQRHRLRLRKKRINCHSSERRRRATYLNATHHILHAILLFSIRFMRYVVVGLSLLLSRWRRQSAVRICNAFIHLFIYWWFDANWHSCRPKVPFVLKWNYFISTKWIHFRFIFLGSATVYAFGRRTAIWWIDDDWMGIIREYVVQMVSSLSVVVVINQLLLFLLRRSLFHLHDARIHFVGRKMVDDWKWHSQFCHLRNRKRN